MNRLIPILYRDEHLVIVRKPSGIHVHKSDFSPGEPALLGILRDQLGQWVYPVHRLDRASSGVLVLALSQENCIALSGAFQERRVAKLYAALVRGWVAESVQADSPIDDGDGQARPAQTQFRCLERYELPQPLGDFATVRASLVSCEPLQGRRHQIRRHAARLNHPILGDTAYGDRHHNHFYQSHFNLCHLQLFSLGIGFNHPQTGKWQTQMDAEALAEGGLVNHLKPYLVQSFGAMPQRLAKPLETMAISGAI